MKRKILSVLIIAMMVTGTCSVALAADTKGEATRENLKSYGAIEYRKGSDKVVIHSDDLYMLADQIDQVKVDVSDQLEAMNTYFTAGDGINLTTDRYISVTHTRPPKADFVDPLTINFDTLLEGIAASQSVSPDVTDYGYSSGTRLYRKEDGSLTTNGSETGATQIDVTVATADNLSAGTAAWVNGRLILGTGGDNKSYFDQGYEKGAEDKQGSRDDPGNSGGSNISGLNRVECINMRGTDNKGIIYVVPEDMTDAILIFFGGKKHALSFEANQNVTYKEVFYKGVTGELYSVCCTVFFAPELKKGTAIPDLEGSCYLVRFKESNSKGGNITNENMPESSYYTSSDLKDVLLLQCGSKNDPAFQEAPGNPIVTFKQLANYGHPRDPGNRNYYFYSLYYIPELKESSTITKYTGGVLFY